jgi:REP element-mobilizing transposase RayT
MALTSPSDTQQSPELTSRAGRSLVHKTHVHLVFVTKYRRSVFDTETLNRGEQVMA